MNNTLLMSIKVKSIESAIRTPLICIWSSSQPSTSSSSRLLDCKYRIIKKTTFTSLVNPSRFTPTEQPPHQNLGHKVFLHAKPSPTPLQTTINKNGNLEPQLGLALGCSKKSGFCEAL
ncbi:hypothetical protein NPIL_429591 [Nephila pilipes]|uniref:Uncharacterized protein n=1 Tax=Nephila pilipes TaxID=299642 RepID=A0A8X6PVF3_NEPPI|nr:hypothetical protein NPIL_429591 [Nephila pilipes]